MKTTPKDFFLNLGVIVGLYISAISFLNLAFSIINTAFPPFYSYGGYASGYYNPSSISWPVATLIIVFPIFILLGWLLEREYGALPEKRELGIRRWLSFITLFLAGIAIAADLIFLLYTFLTGEILTVGFLLKVFSVLIMTAAIFSFYILDIRGRLKPSARKIYAVISTVAVLGLIITGFVIVGSPYKQRALRTDATRVSDLQSIQYQIVYYWQQKKVLPVVLSDLNYPINGFVAPNDPKTGEEYGYRVINSQKFELCANFEADITDARSVAPPNGRATIPGLSKSFGTLEPDVWVHGMGQTCFERTIDPELSAKR